MEKSKKTIARTRNNIRKLAVANFNENSCLFNLYFKDNIENIGYANNEFKKFIKRARYKFGDFKYITVLKFKKSGAIKYLMLTDLGLSIKKDIVEIWNSGWVWIDELKYKNSFNYIIRCMSGDINDERLMGKKAYFTSKNLTRPEIIYEDLSLIDCLKKYNFDTSNLVYENKFMSKENGEVLYYKFNLKRNN